MLCVAQSCNSKLDLKPKDQLTVENILESNHTALTYTLQFYEAFAGYKGNEMLNKEWDGDLFDRGAVNPTGESPWAYNRVNVPNSSDLYTIPFQRIRSINVLLDQADKSSMNEADLNHWKGIAYFFRAYNYFELLRYYGDIKWLEHTAQDTDMEALYGNRTPRTEVADNILRDLKFAVEHIKAEGNGRNTITPDVVRAFISRFGLFEGTWRKYHKQSGSEVFLKASFDASSVLLTKYPSLHENYDELFNSNDLAGVKGVLLYKQYVPTQLTHTAATFSRSSSGRHDLTKKAVDMF